ncbi:MAG: dual specificity protein phosphatase family protein [Planctomycetes bacterium]|nr:dual specificity protein phosphatase family protein [Planctomycetota bacterium]
MSDRTGGEKPAKKRGPLVVILIIALLGGGIWVWEEVLEDRVIPKRFGVVETGMVYRSGQLHPALIEKTLREHEIRRIISLRPDDPENPEHVAEIAAARTLGIEREIYPLGGDGTGDLRNYGRAVRSIVRARDAGEPVLVHCAAGAQRTGGAIAFYRLLVRGDAPKIVFDEMTAYDWDPDDDRILLEYINENMAELAHTLMQEGVIERVPEPLPVLDGG